MKIALIACSKVKNTKECQAVEMYSKSTLFNKTYNYCVNLDYTHIYFPLSMGC